jgi:hypothetical protein
MTDELDLRRAFTTPGGHAPRPEECPDPETIWAAVHGALPPRELRDVVDHTATCGACAEDWRLGLAVEADRDEAPPVKNAQPTPGIEATAAITAIEETAATLAVLFPRRRARFIPLVAAAAAIVLLVVGLPLLHHEDVLRGVGHVISQLHEGEVLPRDACLLQWSGPPGATYDLEVLTQMGVTLFAKRGILDTELRVPEASLAGIRSGTAIDWKVTARVHGEVSHLSSTFTLR